MMPLESVYTVPAKCEHGVSEKTELPIVKSPSGRESADRFVQPPNALPLIEVRLFVTETEVKAVQSSNAE